MIRLPSATTALAIAFLSASPALAQGAGDQGASGRGPPTVFGWYLSTGRVGLSYDPTYMGSNDYHFVPSGSISFSRKGSEPAAWGAPDDGFSLGLVGDKTLSAGLVGRWRSGRGDDDDLRGFDKIDGTVEGGVFANWWAVDWLRVRGEVRHGFGGHDSWTADLGADAVAQLPNWILSFGPRLSWGDNEFNRTYFRVTPVEASRSPFGIHAFDPGDNYWAPGVLGSVEYRFSRFWRVTFVGSYNRLTGDTADSPIVADLGSKDQWSTSISVTYAFVP
jgi:outer membrane protein